MHLGVSSFKNSFLYFKPIENPSRERVKYANHKELWNLHGISEKYCRKLRSIIYYLFLVFLCCAHIFACAQQQCSTIILDSLLYGQRTSVVCVAALVCPISIGT